jgi:hypothetical protein
MNINIRGSKGAVTVEASLVLPLFVCAVLTIAFIIKIVYVQETVQHAINGTADEMASAGYAYCILGLKELSDTANEALEKGQNALNSQVAPFSKLIDDVEILVGNSGVNSDDKKTGDADNKGNIDINTAKDDFKSAVNSGKGILNDPAGFVKSVGCLISAGAFNDLKTELCIPLVKVYLNKYFSQDGKIGAAKRLRLMNISGGMDGLDFSSSRFFENNNDDIDIVVRYEIKLPIPFRIVPAICMEQRVVQKAWTYGDKGKASGNEGFENDIWSLGNLQRGQSIREIFGANLPFDFPVIASFNSGTATMIKSMDTTAPYYQNTENTKEKIMEYAGELKKFNGGKSGNTKIDGSSITKKVLKLVIPENELSENAQAVIDECRQLSTAYGIDLQIIRYEKKKVDDENDER